MAPLALMGAQIEAKQDRFAPFVVHGRPLEAITYDMPVASAQVKSCVLLAGLGAEGTTSVVEPEPSRDHTERMLAGAGIAVTRDGRTVSVTGAEALQSRDLVVPGDLSSAAFMIAAGGARARLAARRARRRRELDADRLPADPRADGRCAWSASWRTRRPWWRRASRSATSR